MQRYFVISLPRQLSMIEFNGTELELRRGPCGSLQDGGRMETFRP
jgi:hypothetical protein